MKALIFGDVSPLIIDGSSIWLASITEVLANVFDEVNVLTKYGVTGDSVLSVVATLSNVHLIDPDSSLELSSDGGHTPQSAAKQASQLDDRRNYAMVLVRGFDACFAFHKNSFARRKLWSYVTDLPFPPERLSANNINRLQNIALNSRRMLSQTDSSRSYLEAIAPNSAGKTLLIPPMIPDPPSRAASSEGKVLRLVYSGKFAKDWKTLEMLELPAELNRIGIRSELHVVGSKFQRDRDTPSWHVRMKESLESACADPESAVIWHGGQSRQVSNDIISSCDYGIGWRTGDLDSSLELSTKALEYGINRTIPIVNRTSDHEAALGSDYPFFSGPRMTARDIALLIERNNSLAPSCASTAFDFASMFTISRAVDRWRGIRSTLENELHPAAIRVGHQPFRLVVSSHDLKFAGEVIDALQFDQRFDVKFDHWRTLHDHDKTVSDELARNADGIFCEFAGPNLVYHSKNSPSHLKLVSRLHGFELRNSAPWLDHIDLDSVDRLVFVSQFYQDLCLQRFGTRTPETIVIPNMVDCSDLARPKAPGAGYTLGVIGYVPFLKRPDRALDVLEELASVSPEYSLVFKGRPPWEYEYVWRNSVQRQEYLEFFDRIRKSDYLRDRVSFEPFSTDIASWLRGVGTVLSPSDHESFHLAPAEGLASGANAVVWAREGAQEIFGDEKVVQDAVEAARRIDLYSRAESVERMRELNSRFAEQNWDKKMIVEDWISLFLST